MTIYKLEKGIKVPKVSVGVGGLPSRVALTLNAMEKGHSFVITSELEALKADKVVRGVNGRERRRKGTRQFVTRRVGKGLRVWRVK